MLYYLLLIAHSLARERCYIQSDDSLPEKIISPRVSSPISELPSTLFWGNFSGQNYLTSARNQHIPEYCGSCWAMAVTSALSDRLMIQRNSTWPEINLSPQVLISCNKENQGCHGGNTLGAYKFINENGITDETCSIYQSRGHNNGLDCSDEIWCKSCDEKECRVPDNYRKYYVEEYGRAIGEEDMIRELQRGPIVCSIDANDAFHSYKGGIFSYYEEEIDINHAISVVGYGEENGVKYWICRNSFGMYWGEKGMVRIYRGNNTIGIEQHCVWAIPSRLYHPKHSISILPTLESYSESFNIAEDIPDVWDWRNVSNTNYLSLSKNQAIPQYLSSSWAMSATSALSDRINILRNTTYPRISLSAQMVINCLSKENATAIDLYRFGYEAGIVDDTCVQYVALENSNLTCSAIQICSNCVRPAPGPGEHSICEAVTNYTLYYVKDYGYLSGTEEMKREIYRRGPITCRLHATERFYRYAGGIYSEDVREIEMNHEVSILGWGKVGKVEYWIGRNSWGTYWGDEGFFMIKMYKDNLGIETDCTWGIPSFQKL